MASPISYDLQGQGGGVTIKAGETVYSRNFRWIQVINDTVLSVLGSVNINGVSTQGPADLTGITLPAGLGIGGQFTIIGVTSGVVIAYFA